MEDIKRKRDEEEEAKKKKEQAEEETKRKERAEALKKKREEMKKIVEADRKRVDIQPLSTDVIEAKLSVSTAPVSTPPAFATDLKIIQRGSKELKSDVTPTPGNISCSAADAMCPWSGPERLLQTHVAGCHYVALRPVLSLLLQQNQETLASLKELKQMYSQLKK